MIFFKSVILGVKGKRLNQIASVLKENKFEVIKTYTALKFVTLTYSLHPNCLLLDYDSLKDNIIVNAMITQGKSFLKNAILISDTKIEGLYTTPLNDLTTAIQLKKNNIIKKNLPTFTNKDYFTTHLTISKYLLDNGLSPKYSGFTMLADFLTLFKLSQKQDADFYGIILQSITHKYNTTSRNIAQNIREILVHSTNNELMPTYSEPNLKQIINHLHTKLLQDTNQTP